MARYTRKTRNHHNKTKKNLHNGEGIVTVGLIYANWCGHCQALKPEWQKMKSNMNKGSYQFHEIEDSDKMKDIKIHKLNKRIRNGKLSANGYPTIFKVKGGNLEYYQGERTSEQMGGFFGSDNKMMGGRRFNYSRRRRRTDTGIKSARLDHQVRY